MQPAPSVKQQDLAVLPGVALNPGDAESSLLLLTVLLPVGRPLALTPALPQSGPLVPDIWPLPTSAVTPLCPSCFVCSELAPPTALLTDLPTGPTSRRQGPRGRGCGLLRCVPRAPRAPGTGGPRRCPTLAVCTDGQIDTVSGCQELPHKLVEKGRQATRLPPSLEG